MTTPWVTGRARGMGRVWAASCFPNAPGAHSFRGRGARPSSPYQTGNARKGLRPCRASGLLDKSARCLISSAAPNTWLDRLIGRRAKVRRGLFRETAVDGQIFGGHAAGCEALLEARPYSLPRQPRELANGANRAGLVLHDETRQPILDDLRHGAAVECDYGGTACHCLDHRQAERLRPVDRDQKGDRPAEEIRFLSIVDLVNIVDERKTHQRLDLLFEIVAIDLVDLGCNLDRQSGALGNTDGAVDAFLWRNATEKRKIVWLHRLRRQQLRGQTVIDRLDPAGLRHGPALRVRYRNHRYRRERRE